MILPTIEELLKLSKQGAFDAGRDYEKSISEQENAELKKKLEKLQYIQVEIGQELTKAKELLKDSKHNLKLAGYYTAASKITKFLK